MESVIEEDIVLKNHLQLNIYLILLKLEMQLQKITLIIYSTILV